MLSHTATAGIVLTAILIAIAFFYLLDNSRYITNTDTPAGTPAGTPTDTLPGTSKGTKKPAADNSLLIGTAVAVVIVVSFFAVAVAVRANAGGEEDRKKRVRDALALGEEEVSNAEDVMWQQVRGPYKQMDRFYRTYDQNRIDPRETIVYDAGAHGSET